MWTCFSFGSGSETQRSRYDHSYNRFEQCDGRSHGGFATNLCQQELGFLLLLRSASVLWFSTCNAADKLFFSSLHYANQARRCVVQRHAHNALDAHRQHAGERMRSHLMNSDHPFSVFSYLIIGNCEH